MSSTGWEVIVAEFYDYVCRSVTNNPGSQKSYVSYIKTLDKVNGGETYEWLLNSLNTSFPKQNLSECFDKYFDNHPAIKPQSQWKTGLLCLGDFIFGFTNSNVNLHSIRNFDTIACKLVAQSAIFCTKEVFEMVKTGKAGARENLGVGNEYGAWYHYTFQRARHNEKRGEYKDGIIRFDDNTHANTAIKTAVLKGLSRFGLHGNSKKIFNGFEACHIWPNTCYDARYHTSVGNLVLLPREIAGLTDHCEAVEGLLKYEAWKRFGFKPAEEEVPMRPKVYKEIEPIWRCTPSVVMIEY